MAEGIPIFDLYDDKTDKYINGDCAILSLALYDLYENFKLVGIFSSDKQQEYPTKGLHDKDYIYQHYLVSMDTEEGVIYIDSEGVWDKENLLKHWRDMGRESDIMNLNNISIETVKSFMKKEKQKISEEDEEYAKNILYRVSKVFKLIRKPYEKNIKARELNFIKENEDIHPKYTFERKNYNSYIVKIERYPMTLIEFSDIIMNLDKNVKEFPGPNGIVCRLNENFNTFSELLDYFYIKVDNMIDILHSKSILHGDLHGNNVVVNPETAECKIIDFGRSYYFDELDYDKILELSEFMGIEVPTSSLTELKAYEHKMYRMQF